ncbi:hypothetical protein DFJ77DRAFT_477122 [Powellomyces hirtus]|nr:hypothetical protein DFJ77DRAFT_477122 [Powellomyces hirtus]
MAESQTEAYPWGPAAIPKTFTYGSASKVVYPQTTLEDSFALGGLVRRLCGAFGFSFIFRSNLWPVEDFVDLAALTTILALATYDGYAQAIDVSSRDLKEVLLVQNNITQDKDYLKEVFQNANEDPTLQRCTSALDKLVHTRMLCKAPGAKKENKELVDAIQGNKLEAKYKDAVEAATISCVVLHSITLDQRRFWKWPRVLLLCLPSSVTCDSSHLLQNVRVRTPNQKVRWGLAPPSREDLIKKIKSAIGDFDKMYKSYIEHIAAPSTPISDSNDFLGRIYHRIASRAISEAQDVQNQDPFEFQNPEDTVTLERPCPRVLSLTRLAILAYKHSKQLMRQSAAGKSAAATSSQYQYPTAKDWNALDDDGKTKEALSLARNSSAHLSALFKSSIEARVHDSYLEWRPSQNTPELQVRHDSSGKWVVEFEFWLPLDQTAKKAGNYTERCSFEISVEHIAAIIVTPACPT